MEKWPAMKIGNCKLQIENCKLQTVNARYILLLLLIATSRGSNRFADDPAKLIAFVNQSIHLLPGKQFGPHNQSQPVSRFS